MQNKWFMVFRMHTTVCYLQHLLLAIAVRLPTKCVMACMARRHSMHCTGIRCTHYRAVHAMLNISCVTTSMHGRFAPTVGTDCPSCVLPTTCISDLRMHACWCCCCYCCCLSWCTPSFQGTGKAWLLQSSGNIILDLCWFLFSIMHTALTVLPSTIAAFVHAFDENSSCR